MGNRTFYGLLIGALVVYAFNLRLDVMQVDAAQYAEMSWEMLANHSYLKVFCLGKDYLDKPPLIFWLCARSFKLFGINNFAYKLPSLLFALLAVFSVYRLAKLFYNEATARMATVMLATCQAVFLITNDVRTDTLLMGAVAFAIWQWAEFFEYGQGKNILLAGLGCALALLAKGPIGVVATGSAILPHVLLSGKWKKLFDLRLLAGLVVVAVMLLPMCIGLYQQFGLQGLRFYFWTQSFGRITGESEWNNHPDTFFLLHTTAWAFLPWSLFLLLGWANALYSLVKNKLSVGWGEEIISVSGFTLVMLMLSLSKYQLPHYIFVAYPLGAIMAANGFVKLGGWNSVRPWLTGLQLTAMMALIVVACLLQAALVGLSALSIIALVVLFPLSVWAAVTSDGGFKTWHSAKHYVVFKLNKTYQAIFGGGNPVKTTATFGLNVLYKKLIVISAALYIVFNFLVSAFYFPVILKYQPQCDFGRYANSQKRNADLICYQTIADYALVFYLQHQPPMIWNKEDFKKQLTKNPRLLVFTTPSGLKALQEEHLPYKMIEERETYNVARLSIDFLNPATRSKVCDKVYLIDLAGN